MPFAKFEQEDRRLVLLRLLAEDTDYKINSSILQQGLGMYGHSISRDKLHSEIAWLTEQDLVSYEELNSVQVVTLTQRGLDVAQGRAVVPGVKRPGPGA
ncbi:ArsR family transcriptional regulator [Amphritea sp. 2_MG-2023]|uniref:VpaChn25_0724 family phage protein n=1 Tax=Amphritea TaxID=515417 RepID=UPI001C079D9D|nr:MULTISPECIES: ArsR family transcriptional regulator [Amphritea]MBU2967072.1 ArsR family transcriptional regulator [Amphritea atlantica]MDO6419375.1 ArsR family transcriptional regulator [Amphritea sp. 2_MG-2023]